MTHKEHRQHGWQSACLFSVDDGVRGKSGIFVHGEKRYFEKIVLKRPKTSLVITVSQWTSTTKLSDLLDLHAPVNTRSVSFTCSTSWYNDEMRHL